MDESKEFSERHQVRPQPGEVEEWKAAPKEIRSIVAYAARQSFSSERIRDLFCSQTGNVPDLNNWSDENVWRECISILDQAEWYEIYDIAEKIWKKLPPNKLRAQSRKSFELRLNRTLQECGIGWKMVQGCIVARGESGFEAATRKAEEFLRASARGTARRELEEALRDLARRPEPDVTGAIQHSMAALECVARDITGKPNKNLGQVIKKEADLLALRKPLDGAVHKMWGYASQMARHLEEGKNPSREEAELVVTFASALIAFFGARDL